MPLLRKEKMHPKLEVKNWSLYEEQLLCKYEDTEDPAPEPSGSSPPLARTETPTWPCVHGLPATLPFQLPACGLRKLPMTAQILEILHLRGQLGGRSWLLPSDQLSSSHCTTWAVKTHTQHLPLSLPSSLDI